MRLDVPISETEPCDNTLGDPLVRGSTPLGSTN
jgi:hypothetical protein